MVSTPASATSDSKIFFSLLIFLPVRSLTSRRKAWSVGAKTVARVVPSATSGDRRVGLRGDDGEGRLGQDVEVLGVVVELVAVGGEERGEAVLADRLARWRRGRQP